MKYSRKRDAIFEVINSTKSHPNADWVYTTLKPNYTDLSLGTVYRNIALFREMGLLSCVATVNGQERFDANTAPHTHFVCAGCGCVFDLDIPNPEVSPSFPLPGLPGATAQSCLLTYYGACGSCSVKE